MYTRMISGEPEAGFDHLSFVCIGNAAPLREKSSPKWIEPYVSISRTLEERLHNLNNRIMENTRTLDERNRLESEIRAAQLALTHYHEALKLERQLDESETILES
jgi:hypothetical protein